MTYLYTPNNAVPEPGGLGVLTAALVGLGLLEERADGALVLHRLLGAFVRRAAAGELPAALDAVDAGAREVTLAHVRRAVARVQALK